MKHIILQYDTFYYDYKFLIFTAKTRRVLMNKRKKFWWMLITLCLIIFTLQWRSFNGNGEKIIKIGIIQFVEHEALDASRNGFINGLKENNFRCEIDYKNAQGDQANCVLIANQFAANNYDLILAIATPAAQSAAAVTTEIPVLVTAITNPEDAGVVKSNKKPATNVTGTSDLAPIEKQIGLIKKLKPEAKKVGILFSSNEANSKYQSEIAAQEAKKIGLKPIIFTFSQMTEIQQVVESMLDKVDVIYTPTDNMVASNMPIISKIAAQKAIPVICGEVNLVSKGAIGTYGMDYYELGKITSKQAIKILKEGARPENMPIEYLQSAKLVLNHEIIKKMNLKEISP